MSETNPQNAQQVEQGGAQMSPANSEAGYEKPYSLEPNIEAALSYIPLVGIAVFIMEKESKFVRFHALQSILFWVAVLIVQVVLSSTFVFLFVISAFLSSVVSIAAAVGALLAGWKAYSNEEFEFPFIGKIAHDQVNK